MTSLYGHLAPPRVMLALDPGLRNPAIAVFVDGTVHRAARVKIPGATHKIKDRAMRSAKVAELIFNDLRDGPERDVELVVLEWPQVYRAGRSKGDPNDLLPLVGISMYLCGLIGVPMQSYLPRDWAGGSQKSTTGDPLVSPRGRMIWNLLSGAERDVVDVSHDALDAVGIGLHYLGRGPRRVYPGATED